MTISFAVYLIFKDNIIIKSTIKLGRVSVDVYQKKQHSIFFNACLEFTAENIVLAS